MTNSFADIFDSRAFHYFQCSKVLKNLSSNRTNSPYTEFLKLGKSGERYHIVICYSFIILVARPYSNLQWLTCERKINKKINKHYHNLQSIRKVRSSKQFLAMLCNVRDVKLVHSKLRYFSEIKLDGKVKSFISICKNFKCSKVCGNSIGSKTI